MAEGTMSHLIPWVRERPLAPRMPATWPEMGGGGYMSVTLGMGRVGPSPLCI